MRNIIIGICLGQIFLFIMAVSLMMPLVFFDFIGIVTFGKIMSFLPVSFVFMWIGAVLIITE